MAPADEITILSKREYQEARCFRKTNRYSGDASGARQLPTVSTGSLTSSVRRRYSRSTAGNAFRVAGAVSSFHEVRQPRTSTAQSSGEFSELNLQADIHSLMVTCSYRPV